MLVITIVLHSERERSRAGEEECTTIEDREATQDGGELQLIQVA
jgi:hypothetical protein